MFQFQFQIIIWRIFLVSHGKRLVTADDKEKACFRNISMFVSSTKKTTWHDLALSTSTHDNAWYPCNYWLVVSLVGGFNFLKHMKVSWDYYSQHMEKTTCCKETNQIIYLLVVSSYLYGKSAIRDSFSINNMVMLTIAMLNYDYWWKIVDISSIPSGNST